MKKEFFDKLSSIIKEVVGIADYKGNRLECVDARVLLVNVMVEYGETENSIGEMLKMSQQRVNYLKNSFRRRIMRKRFQKMTDEVHKKLTNYLQEKG